MTGPGQGETYKAEEVDITKFLLYPFQVRMLWAGIP